MARPAIVTLVLSYLAFIALGLPDAVFGVAWPSLQRAFGVPPSAMAAVLTAGVGGYFVSGLCAGAAANWLGVGGLLTLSTALVAAALFGYALAPSWSAFFPFGAVIGLGSGAIDSGLNGYAARQFPVRHVNWLHGCWGIGASLGPLIMTLCIARDAGYRGGYALLGAVLAAMALLFLFTRQRWEDARRGSATDAGSARARALEPKGALAALRSKTVWLQLVVFFLYCALESTVGQWGFSWLRDRRGLGVEAAGAWTSAYWASLTVGRLAIGVVVDRVGPERTLRAATALAMLGATLFATAPQLPGRLGLLLLGSSLAPMFPTLMARTHARVGRGLAAHAVGFQVSAATLGSALGPSLAGLWVARAGIGAAGATMVGFAAALAVAHEVLLGASRRPSGQAGATSIR